MKSEIGIQKTTDPSTEYQRPKDPPIFDMMVIIGLIFNVLIVIFVLLYWLNLL